MNYKSVTKVTISVMVAIAFSVTLITASKEQAKNKKSVLEQASHQGKVIITMDSGRYTYVQFEEKGQKLWVACQQTSIKIGDLINFGQAAVMKNFYSKTLKRTFAEILFVSRIMINGQKRKDEHTALPKGHAAVKGKNKKADIKVLPGSIKKADNGYTVAECYAKKDKLKGKVIKVRGKVVKFSSQIMAKNWIHIQDGTGKQGTNDLTITTIITKVKPGDIILVTGKLYVNKDFGAGYVYPVIIEEALIKVE